MTELLTVTETPPPVESPPASTETTSGEEFVSLRSVPDAASGAIAPTAGSVPEPVDKDAAVRAQARRVWQESAEQGQPLTGLELGARFDRSERWGRARIAEARHAEAQHTTGGTVAGRPARRRRTVGTTNSGGTVTGTTPARQPSAGTAVSGVVAAAVSAANPQTRPATPAPPGTDVPAAAPAVPGVPGVPGVPAIVPGGARLVAWAGFLFGTVISVAANVLHAWLPTLAGKAGTPGLAPQVGAAVWPIALVISVEVLSRVPWRPGWTWQLARYGGAGVVALGAAVISYGHLHGVLAAWGYGTTGAAVGPLVVDGLMTISGFALLAMSSHTDTGTPGNHHGTGNGTGEVADR